MTQVEVIDRTDEAKTAADIAIERALHIIGGKLVRYAALNCPVDTGLLRNSITYALDGEEPQLKSYKAAYGSAKKANGKRYSAGSAKAGSVGVGFYAGQVPPEEDGARSVSVGTNVEYAEYVEFGEKARHTVGRAHFIRDSVADHMGEYKHILDNELRKGS